MARTAPSAEASGCRLVSSASRWTCSVPAGGWGGAGTEIGVGSVPEGGGSARGTVRSGLAPARGAVSFTGRFSERQPPPARPARTAARAAVRRRRCLGACPSKTRVLFRANRIEREERSAMKRVRTVYHHMVPLALALMVPFSAGPARGQGTALPPIKVDLPPPPNFNIQNAPEKYPTGEMSIFGLRKHMSMYLDKDVQLKAFLLEIYECPAEQRKCNDELAAKAKKEAKSEKKKKEKENGAPPNAPAAAAAEAMKGGCRPCDQPHFFLGDTATTKLDHGLLVADYPVKDWKTGKPKALVAKAGEQYVVTGTFAINSMAGFAASDGLIIHKKFQDASGAVISEGNAVLPPEAQDIKLEGKAAEKVGGARIDAEKADGKGKKL